MPMKVLTNIEVQGRVCIYVYVCMCVRCFLKNIFCDGLCDACSRGALLRYIMQIAMNIKVLCVPGKDVINNLCGPVFLLLCFYALV